MGELEAVSGVAKFIQDFGVALLLVAGALTAIGWLVRNLAKQTERRQAREEEEARQRSEREARIFDEMFKRVFGDGNGDPGVIGKITVQMTHLTTEVSALAASVDLLQSSVATLNNRFDKLETSHTEVVEAMQSRPCILPGMLEDCPLPSAKPTE